MMVASIENLNSELVKKIEKVKALHAPAYYILVRRVSASFGGNVTEALYVGDEPPTYREPSFVLCAVCHSHAIVEDEEYGIYYSHTGSYPCDTVKALT